MKRALLLSGVAGLVLTTQALAADLSFPSLPEPVIPHIEMGNGGWYLRGDVGTGVQDYDGVDATIVSGTGTFAGYARIGKYMDDPTTVGFGVGYQWSDFLRFDATAEYRSASSWGFTIYNAGTGDGNEYNANLSSVLGLVNAYYDIGNFWGVTPFVGGGVGYAYHSVTGFEDIGIAGAAGGYGYAADENDGDFAWALHAGLGYDINDKLKLEASYRYVDMGTFDVGSIVCLCGDVVQYDMRDVTSHDMRVGMRWTFGEPEASVPVHLPQEPIVRKY